VAVLASLLVGISMLTQRAQVESLRINSEAGSLGVEAANAATRHVAAELRQHLDHSTIALIRLIPESDSAKGIRGTKLAELHKQLATFQQELKQLEQVGADLRDRTRVVEQSARVSAERVDWLDFAILAMELGIILCSITLLTRRTEYWYGGLLAAGLGLGLVAAAYTAI
jgi:hypothetical protein